ncbi:MAG: bacteriochlorophyll 4-vinyl reductase [Alphaproteobacteria bacterium]|nr:bacteriochlorophyll 4-vinyl reductase [Alphaproteobacteria bacterium]
MALADPLAPPAGAAAHPDGLIGPNAVIQLRAALAERAGEAAALGLFLRAGLADWAEARLDAMIPQAVPAALFETLFAAYPHDAASEIAAEAGRRTADYVMAHRIPGPVKALLKALPAPLAARLLLKAIQRNAWTFAGSGVCRAAYGAPSRVEIAGNPLAMPGCVWHVGVFSRLFQALVSRRARVTHPACARAGDPLCRFEIALD